MTLGISVKDIVETANNPLLGIHPSWQRVLLGDVAKVVNGFAFKSSQFNKSKIGMPLLRIRDIESMDTDVYYDGEYDDDYIIKQGDLIIGMDGDFNCARWTGPKALLNQRVCKVELNSPLYNSKFLYYVLPGYLKAINDHTSSVTVKHLSSRTVAEIPLPLPPLPEQERIVNRIEELFSDLDAGVAALERVRAGLKRYKASLLKAAVEGKLVNGKLGIGEGELPDGWRWVTMPEVGHLGRGKSKHRPRNADFLYGGKYPFIQTGDIRHADGVITSYTQTYSEAGLAQSKLWKKGTLCITIAANIAETAILGIDACFPDSVVGFVPNDDVDVKFVEFYVRTIKDNLERYAPATAQKNINLDVLQKVEIPLPPLDEQRRIVAEVERRLSVVGEVESAVEVGLVRAGRLRQAVLRSAFEGRL